MSSSHAHALVEFSRWSNGRPFDSDDDGPRRLEVALKADPAPSPAPVFSETQRFRQWWLWAPLLVLLAIASYLFVKQIIFGDPQGKTPAPNWVIWTMLITSVFGLLALAVPKLVVNVQSDGISVTFAPLRQRLFKWDEIHRYEAVTYRPLREYGGWGYRIAGRGNRALSVSGNQGVRLHGRQDNAPDGRPWQLLIGSQRSSELFAAIRQFHSTAAS